jgi:hypothetical protein
VTALLAAAVLWLSPQDAIDAGAYRADVGFLASDILEGRKAGERGARVAGDYLASRMQQIGLAPLGDPTSAGGRSYLQEFLMGIRDLDAGSLEIRDRAAPETNAASQTTEALAMPADFVPIVGSAEGSFAGEAVFVGYGITAPECAWDDYAGVDAKGKVAIALRHEPFANDDSSNVWLGKRFTRHARFEEKARNAKAHGAVALLIVPDLATFPDGKKKKSVPGLGYWKSTSSIGQMVASMSNLLPPDTLEKHNVTHEEIADQGYWLTQAPELGRALPIPTIFVRSGACGRLLDVTAAENAILEAKAPRSRPLPTIAISGRVTTKIEGSPCWNVVGLLRGSDPELSRSYVVVGGHYDHVGFNKSGEVWNGADDNASGASAVLAIAASLAAAPPKRSVIFVNFAAEEVGLLGSFYFAAQPPVPLASISAMVNCDMIGRGGDEDKKAEPTKASLAEEVFVSGSPSSPVWDPILRKANVGIGLTTTADETFFDRSDQAAFYFKSIPILFFNTGEHGDYHGPNDTAERLNFDKALRIVKLAARCVAAAANLPGDPPFVDFQERVDLPAGKAKKNWAMGITNFLERSDL